MTMTRVLKSIFNPQDGRGGLVKDEVITSRKKVENAADRFESTILELLKANDLLTRSYVKNANQVRK